MKKSKIKINNIETIIIFFAVAFGCIIIAYCINKYKNKYINKYDTFINYNNIDYYVITMHNADRIKNIEKQIKLLKQSNANINMIYVDAVVGKSVNIDDLIDKKILTNNIYENKDAKFTAVFEKRKNEVGCYLSHCKAYNMIKDKGNLTGYSVIFEDDFEITDDFSKIFEETLSTLDGYEFDMLFLGILGDKGEHVVSNVYHTTKESFCAHAYVIKNKNINKIIDEMKYIDTIVDVTIFEKGHNKELTIFRLDSPIVDQFNFGTTIR